LFVWVGKRKESELGGHVAQIGDRRGAYNILLGHLGKRDHWEDLDVDWRIILKWIFKKLDGKARNGFIWLRIGTGVRRL
jgi:hypothetical protein